MKLSRLLLVITFVVTSGCATIKEVAEEYPALTNFGIAAVTMKHIEKADNPKEKAGKIIAGIGRFKIAGELSITYGSLGEVVRKRLGYASMLPSDKFLTDETLKFAKLVIQKELAKRGMKIVPADYKIDLGFLLDAIEAGARVYLPQ